MKQAGGLCCKISYTAAAAVAGSFFSHSAAAVVAAAAAGSDIRDGRFRRRETVSTNYSPSGLYL